MPPKINTKLKLKIKAKSDAPVVNQIAEQLREMIRSGGIAAGVKLPGERTLGEQLGADRSTIKQAYQMLEVEGIIETVPQSGRFVSSNKRKPGKRKE